MWATEQRANITFCVLLNRSPSETLKMLYEVYSKAVVKKTQAYKWHTPFCDGHASVNDDLCGRLQSILINKNIECIGVGGGHTCRGNACVK
jgi:hypothetical protein